MRLSVEQIKQGIVHPERIVRDYTMRYFSDAFSDDQSVMPLATQAIEGHGWDDAFEYAHCLSLLAQTEETLLWLMARLEEVGRPKTHEQAAFCSSLASVISGADAALLMKHEQSILDLEGLEADYREIIADRLRLLTLDSESYWRELEGLCEKYKGTHYINEFPVGAAFRLCEAISRDKGCADRVLSILSSEVENYENNPLTWLECFATRLAGELRLEAAVPLLVDKLKKDGGDLLNEECQTAFVMVGTDAVVEAICQDFTAAPWHYRLYASSALANIRSDLVVPRCLELLGQDQSGEMVEASLIRAVLQSFSSDGIEIGRRFTLTGDNEVQRVLVAAAMLTGVSFPELEAWKAEEDRAAEDRKRRREMLLAHVTKRQTNQELLSSVEQLIDPQPAAPITREEKVGRNDPCPCGSGKKYKKCCGR